MGIESVFLSWRHKVVLCTSRSRK